MKKLLVLISAACLLIPAIAFAQNPSPTLYLEIYADDAHCICPYVQGGDPLPCYRSSAGKGAWMPAYIFIHVGKVPNGFLGVPFGMVTSGGAMFSSCTACPGFLKGPSTAGEPAAVIVSSTGECHQWQHHPIYCMWLSQDANDDVFTLVASGDLGHYMVINCNNEYDTGTVLGHGAAWAASQPFPCGDDPTPVDETTWGKIKGLYR